MLWKPKPKELEELNQLREKAGLPRLHERLDDLSIMNWTMIWGRACTEIDNAGCWNWDEEE